MDLAHKTQSGRRQLRPVLRATVVPDTGQIPQGRSARIASQRTSFYSCRSVFLEVTLTDPSEGPLRNTRSKIVE